jgi:hypothetical protein
MRIGDGAFEPRGPQGIEQRVAEIRARCGVPDPTFAVALQGQLGGAGKDQPKPLEGSIGGTAKQGFAPMNPFDPSMGVTGPGGTPTDKLQLKSMAAQIARDHGIDPKLMDAVIEQESDYNPLATSKVGAQGLMQLMPDTAKSLGVTNPYDPAQNMQGGAKYLRQLIDQFKDVRLALAAYNAGPSRVAKIGGVPDIPETQNYVNKIASKL